MGGGFAGLAAAKGLAGSGIAVTLVDRRNFHLFQPLLYQIATGGLSPGDIASPLRAVARKWRNVRVVQAEVTGFDLHAQRVLLAQGELPFDWLVVATGVTPGYFGHDTWSELAPGLKTVEDALRMRRLVLGAFERAETCDDPERRRAELTLVVIGGGPTGVELAGAIGELARHTLRGEFRSIDPREARVLLLEGGDRILAAFPELLAGEAGKALARLGVEVHCKTRVTEVSPEGLDVVGPDGPARIAAGTVLWAAGMRAGPLGAAICRAASVETDAMGRVPVGADLTLAGHPHVFVLGDLARCVGADGTVLPGVAPVAMQQGAYAAARIRAGAGAVRPLFRYRDKGLLAVIGRNAAVGVMGRLQTAGFPAWLVWCLVHLRYLVEFDNKLLVLIQWAWSYFTRNRGSRLITP